MGNSNRPGDGNSSTSTLNELASKHPLIAALLGATVSLTGTYNMVATHDVDIKKNQVAIQQLERDYITQNARIDTMVRDQAKFDKTLDALNLTLIEVNKTLTGIQITVETLKDRKKQS